MKIGEGNRMKILKSNRGKILKKKKKELGKIKERVDSINESNEIKKSKRESELLKKIGLKIFGEMLGDEEKMFWEMKEINREEKRRKEIWEKEKIGKIEILRKMIGEEDRKIEMEEEKNGKNVWMVEEGR